MDIHYVAEWPLAQGTANTTSAPPVTLLMFWTMDMLMKSLDNAQNLNITR